MLGHSSLSCACAPTLYPHHAARACLLTTFLPYLQDRGGALSLDAYMRLPVEQVRLAAGGGPVAPTVCACCSSLRPLPAVYGDAPPWLRRWER